MNHKEILHKEMQEILTKIFGADSCCVKSFSYEECIQELEYLLTAGSSGLKEALYLLTQAAIVNECGQCLWLHTKIGEST